MVIYGNFFHISQLLSIVTEQRYGTEKMKKSSSGRELVRTVAGEQLTDVVFDTAEVALDGILSEGVLKEYQWSEP